ncbi:hypothetical protein HYC85_020606 [Camellia sinensis]|uniref:Endoplasmic reticulum vesicle transporter C-terminal domain-containing protein n=1 Tax=Camellia sinensis TaxID=4442 RepID=A0A7J7GU30_CAMSI|nr:hypothetical protein HYC85_020606 [Camellia sinensis]
MVRKWWKKGLDGNSGEERWREQREWVGQGLYLYTVTETQLLVDTSRGETLRINFDVTFPALPCSILSLDAMDISGEQHLDVKHDIVKKRLDTHGNVIEERQDGIGAPKIEKPLQRHGGRLEHNETYCGSCYGAEVSDDDCCNSCDEVRELYRKKGWALSNPDSIDQCKREGFLQRIKDEEGEGCNIYGFLEVNKVAGNFHFAPGKSFHQSGVHVHDLLVFQKDSFNVSHKINKLAFGEYFPGVVNPLDRILARTRRVRVEKMRQTGHVVMKKEAVKALVGIPLEAKLEVEGGLEAGIEEESRRAIRRRRACNSSWENVAESPKVLAKDSKRWAGVQIVPPHPRVVPTVYTDVRGHTIQSNQFSVTEHFRSAEEVGLLQSLPGVFFFYDLSPIKVTFTEEHISFLHFLTNVCAIVGGVFTVSGILDSFIYHGQRAIKKMEIGKFS